MFERLPCPIQLDCFSITGATDYCPNLGQCSSFKVQTTELSNQFVFNRDWQTRDTILFGQPMNWSEEWVSFAFGATKFFRGLAIADLQLLLELQFIHPYQSRHTSPTTEAFLEFAQFQQRKGFELVFEGFAIHPKRQDYRVTLNGLAYEEEPAADLIRELQEFAVHADEFTVSSDYLRAKWN